MRKSKLDTSHIKKEVTKRLAVGESQVSIARAVGLDQSQVSRWSRKEEIRTGIEEEQRKLLEVVPDAVENVKCLVREMKDIPAKDTKRRELSYMATKDVLKSVGILPTQLQSQTFINITQTKNTLISPVVAELLRHVSESFKLTEEDMNVSTKEGNNT